MPSLKIVRKRIQSVKNTEQITKAMKMVAAAKLRRAQQNVVNARPFSKMLLTLMNDIISSSASVIGENALFSNLSKNNKTLYIVMSSDRGLCGSFNTTIIKKIEHELSENKGSSSEFIFVGKRASDYFRRRNLNINSIYENTGKNSTVIASEISKKILKKYSEGEYRAVILVYTEFKTAMSQVLMQRQLLPITNSNDALKNTSSGLKEKDSVESKDNCLIEPDVNLVFDYLVKQQIENQIYVAALESFASEQGARMTAMENATKNAGEMIRKLSLIFNKTRQASITKEMLEIVGGTEALK